MSGEIIGYLSESEATELIRLHVPSGQKRREAWETLDEGGREAFLRIALISLERLKYSGARRDKRQALEFPRAGTRETPPKVPLAQALEACALAADGGEASMRAALRAQGVGSFSAGNLRENYTGGGSGALLSREAAALLSGFMAGVSALD